MRSTTIVTQFEAEDRWLRSFRYSPVQGTLTPVQSLVAQLIACGLSDKEIAFFLGVAASTIKAHNTRILKSFGLSRRTEVVRFMLESGMFDPEEAEQLLAGRSEAF